MEKIDFTVTIYEAEERRQNFGQVSNSYIHIQDMASGTDLIRYDLGEDFSIETAIVVGELYRHNGEWKFNAIGSGYQGAWRRCAPTTALTWNKEENIWLSVWKRKKSQSEKGQPVRSG